jgi:hypothetical protein
MGGKINVGDVRFKISEVGRREISGVSYGGNFGLGKIYIKYNAIMVGVANSWGGSKVFNEIRWRGDEKIQDGIVSGWKGNMLR